MGRVRGDMGNHWLPQRELHTTQRPAKCMVSMHDEPCMGGGVATSALPIRGYVTQSGHCAKARRVAIGPFTL